VAAAQDRPPARLVQEEPARLAARAAAAAAGSRPLQRQTLAVLVVAHGPTSSQRARQDRRPMVATAQPQHHAAPAQAAVAVAVTQAALGMPAAPVATSAAAAAAVAHR
jgi:hypothetical protein